MRDHRHFLFYADAVDTHTLKLDSSESHHAVSVLRLTKGDRFMATDGAGSLFECRCDALTKTGVSGAILTRSAHPRHPCQLHLLVGIPVRSAFETLLVNAAALGVMRITPVIFKHCQETWWEGSWTRQESRFLGKMIASIKQARYPWLPQLDAPLQAEQAPGLAGDSCIVAEPNGTPFAEVIEILQVRTTPVVAVIGPPGGLSEQESAAFKARGALSVAIAPTRLTTELAALVLAAQILGACVNKPRLPPFPEAAA
ncbi:MAG: RsmE family RNA methyltransferase [Chitinispirillaceae bacterium]|nr:RsmE family RNA methyltransferase [Chitinispirillaceae bacterium]